MAGDVAGCGLCNITQGSLGWMEQKWVYKCGNSTWLFGFF